MDEKSLATQLRKEGFSHMYVWQDGPNAHYPDHTHAEETAHIVLSGEMALTLRCARQRRALCSHGAPRLPLLNP
jgi:hypothetical protein